MKETVVLLHGIWMNSLVMRVLGERLRKCGFEVCYFSYSSLRLSPEKNADRLQQQVESIDSDIIHFVGHSLGGLVLLHLFHKYPLQKPGRVLLLGSPVHGSHIANRLKHTSIGSRILGKSIDHGLLGDAPKWKAPRDLGMIAGTVGFGIGLLFGKMPETNDGAVTLSETRMQGITQYIECKTTHTGLLFSTKVADLSCAFLKSGQFSPR